MVATVENRRSRSKPLAQRQELHPNQGRSKLSKNSFFRFRSSLLLTGIFLSNSARRWKNIHPQAIRKRTSITTKITTKKMGRTFGWKATSVRMEGDQRKDGGGQRVEPSANALNRRSGFALHSPFILRSQFRNPSAVNRR